MPSPAGEPSSARRRNRSESEDKGCNQRGLGLDSDLLSLILVCVPHRDRGAPAGKGAAGGRGRSPGKADSPIEALQWTPGPAPSLRRGGSCSRSALSSATLSHRQSPPQMLGVVTSARANTTLYPHGGFRLGITVSRLVITSNDVSFEGGKRVGQGGWQKGEGSGGERGRGGDRGVSRTVAPLMAIPQPEAPHPPPPPSCATPSGSAAAWGAPRSCSQATARQVRPRAGPPASP